MSNRIGEQIAAAEQRWKDRWAAGPTRLRWTSLPPQVGDPAPDATLPDHTGAPTALSDLWRDRPLLVLFWRHFGCSCGMDRAERLRSELGGYRAAGGDVVIVGQGEPERAAHYRERQHLDVPILSDPDRSTYEAFGLLQGTTAQVLFDAPDPFLRCAPRPASTSPRRATEQPVPSSTIRGSSRASSSSGPMESLLTSIATAGVRTIRIRESTWQRSVWPPG